MRDPALVRVVGPLAPFVEGFRVSLELVGYTPGSQVVHLRLMAQLSRWLHGRGLDGSALSTAVMDEFLLDTRARRHGARSVRSRRQPLLEYLREIVPVPPVPPVVGPVEALLLDYGAYLVHERGLAATTVQRHTDLVRPFLAARLCAVGLDLATLRAGDVVAFMLARSRCVSPATVQRTGTALRSLLRFLHVQGVIGSSLVGAVPTAANWKLAGLPKYVTREQVAALLGSCDRGTAVGRRDLAILTLLARLGLRAGEVAALRLEDIDWRRGEITVRGKGNRHERLPLPADVGEAVVVYLSGSRPTAAAGREVFAATRAPHRTLTRGAVTQLVARASRRCGLGTIYAHRLRHTAATAMLHAGASLEEIGQVLRHRHALTTAGYAKVDHEGLRALARRWPGSVA
jgi:integrase/recombinase XerD